MDWQQILDYAKLTAHAPAANGEAAVEGVQRRLGRLTYERVPRPQPFFTASDSGRRAYGETVAAYLVGLPNAALQMAVRCLEIALQEQYQVVEGRESDGDLRELIRWAEGHLAARTAVFERFGALHHLAHRHRSVEEHELLTPLTAVRDVTALLNEFYPLPDEMIPQRLDCPECGETHTHELSRRQYYLGSIVSLRCDRGRVARLWMIDWL